MNPRARLVLTGVLWSVPVLVAALPWLVQMTTAAPILWWAARAFGFVSYVALWCAMATGLLMSSPRFLARLDRKVVFELHQQWTLSAILATALHVLAVVSHEPSGIGIVAALVPYASEQLTGPLALGVLAFWGLAVLAATSWLRPHVPYGAWRGIHALAFGAFVLGLAHSVSAGTDTGYVVVRWLYAASGAALAAGTAARIASAAVSGRRRTSMVVHNRTATTPRPAASLGVLPRDSSPHDRAAPDRARATKRRPLTSDWRT
jgi:predicted ferric reductase